MIKFKKQSDMMEKIKTEMRFSILDLLMDLNGSWYQFSILGTLCKVSLDYGSRVLYEHKLPDLIKAFPANLKPDIERFRNEKGYITEEYTDLLKLRFKEWIKTYTIQTEYEFTTITKNDTKQILKFLDQIGV